MIKLQDLTPNIYYEQSRDFQFIGRLFDIVLNHVKTNADNLYNLPIGENMNERLLNLLATTLGFQSKHNYNSRQLLAICSILPKILKNKGSFNAIIIAVNSLLYAEGIQQALDYSIDPGKSITLYLPTDLSDLSLLRDLLIYILPAGIGCRMVKEISETHTIETTIATKDTITWYKEDSKQLNQVLKVKDASVKSKLATGGPNNEPGMLVNISTAKKVVKTDTETTLTEGVTCDEEKK